MLPRENGRLSLLLAIVGFFWAVSWLIEFGELSRKPVLESSRFLNLTQGEGGEKFLGRMGGAQGQGR